jgi:hypothetical protein
MSNPVPLDLQAKIADWRLRAAAGTLTLPEMKEAIVHLRAGRISAYSTGVAAKKKAVAAVPAAADMLADLEGL